MHFCSRYADILKLKRCYDLEIHDARQDNSWLECSKNIDLDDGVILIVENNCFQGVQALDTLLRLCRYKGVFFGIHRLVFSNSFIGRIAYGALKGLRKTALFLKRCG